MKAKMCSAKTKKDERCVGRGAVITKREQRMTWVKSSMWGCIADGLLCVLLRGNIAWNSVEMPGEQPCSRQQKQDDDNIAGPIIKKSWFRWLLEATMVWGLIV